MSADIIFRKFNMKRPIAVSQPDVRYWRVHELPPNLIIMDFIAKTCIRPAFKTTLAIAYQPEHG